MRYDRKELIKKMEKAENDCRKMEAFDAVLWSELYHEIGWQLSERKGKTVTTAVLNDVVDTSEANVIESCQESLSDACSEAMELMEE